MGNTGNNTQGNRTKSNGPRNGRNNGKPSAATNPPAHRKGTKAAQDGLNEEDKEPRPENKGDTCQHLSLLPWRLGPYSKATRSTTLVVYTGTVCGGLWLS